MALGGFFDDLFTAVKNEGKERAIDLFNQQFGNTDHIAAQNQTGANLAAIDAAYWGGSMDAATAIDRIRQVTIGFVTYARQPQFGSRGQRGAADIEALANQLIVDIQNASGLPAAGLPTGGNPYTPYPTTGTGFKISSEMLLIGGGVLALVLLSSRRRD